MCTFHATIAQCSAFMPSQLCVHVALACQCVLGVYRCATVSPGQGELLIKSITLNAMPGLEAVVQLRPSSAGSILTIHIMPRMLVLVVIAVALHAGPPPTCLPGGARVPSTAVASVSVGQPVSPTRCGARK